MAIRVETETGRRLVRGFGAVADTLSRYWLASPAEPKSNWDIPKRYLVMAIFGFFFWWLLSETVPGVIPVPAFVAAWFTKIFIAVMTYFVIPLVIASLWLAISKNLNAWKLFLATSLYFTITTVLACSAGLYWGGVFAPGGELDLPETGGEKAFLARLIDYFLSPPWRGVDIVMFVLVLLGATVFIKKVFPTTGRKYDDFFEEVQEFGVALMSYVLRFMPLALFLMMFDLGSRFGLAVFQGSMSRILLADICGMATHGAILTFGILLRYGFVNGFRFVKTAMPAVGMGIATRSSQVTLPKSLQCAQRFGIPEQVREFNLPFGATTNMDGTAVAIAVRIIFVLSFVAATGGWAGQLDFWAYAGIIGVVIAGSVGTAAAPGASVALLPLALTMVSSMLDIPISPELITGMVALVVAVDAFSDPLRTGENIYSDLSSTAWMSIWFGQDEVPDETEEDLLPADGKVGVEDTPVDSQAPAD